MKQIRSISFEGNLWSRIDKLRGDVPRSRFIEKIIFNDLKSPN